jgi:hypothetical protein
MKAKVAVISPSRADLVDEFGELDRRARVSGGWKEQADRYEALKKVIKSWHDASPATAEAVELGKFWEVQVSGRAKERKVRSMMVVYKAIGSLAGFFSLCEIGLGKLEEKLGKARVATMVSEEFTGSRRLTAVLRSAPNKAA